MILNFDNFINEELATKNGVIFIIVKCKDGLKRLYGTNADFSVYKKSNGPELTMAHLRKTADVFRIMKNEDDNVKIVKVNPDVMTKSHITLNANTKTPMHWVSRETDNVSVAAMRLWDKLKANPGIKWD